MQERKFDDMAHLTSFKIGGACGILRHDERTEHDKVEQRKNECIDNKRTHLNYNLAPKRTGKLLEHIKNICEKNNVRFNNRKDLNVMCSWIVTAPKDLSKDKQPFFFEQCYNFLCQRYGSQYVLSATVHNDETTPHLHFCFIPVGYDKKNDRYTVSSKLVATRTELRNFQLELNKHLERFFGYDVGILNKATKEGNRSIDELKRQSAIERLQEATTEASKIVSKAQKEAQRVTDSIEPLKVEYEARKAYIRACDEASEVSMMYPSYAERKKSFFGGKETVIVPKEKWEQKHISANEKRYLDKATSEFEKAVEKFRETTSANYIEQLEKTIKSLEKQNCELREQLISVKDNKNEIIDKINMVLSNLPDEVSERFIKQWNNLEHSNFYGRKL